MTVTHKEALSPWAERVEGSCGLGELGALGLMELWVPKGCMGIMRARRSND